jgi:hypothetical protein
MRYSHNGLSCALCALPRASISRQPHNNLLAQSPLMFDSFSPTLRPSMHSGEFDMKRALINGLLISALVAAAPAFAGDVVQSSGPDTANFTGKTRAEVKAELATARRNGDLEAVNERTYPQLLPYQQRRAQLVASRVTKTQ